MVLDIPEPSVFYKHERLNTTYTTVKIGFQIVEKVAVFGNGLF